MNVRRIGVFVLGGIAAVISVRGGLVRAGGDEKSAFAAADAQILSEIREHSELMAHLEYLSDTIGPRLTGYAQLKQDNHWTRNMFAKHGLTNAHLQPWTMRR